MSALHVTPLCPAGHLPHKGGDQLSLQLSPHFDLAGQAPQAELQISPLVGEMSGRTEGGAKERDNPRRISSNSRCDA